MSIVVVIAGLVVTIGGAAVGALAQLPERRYAAPFAGISMSLVIFGFLSGFVATFWYDL